MKTVRMADLSDSGNEHSRVGSIHQGQPDFWTLAREGHAKPMFSLQKHMPEITIGRSTECTLSCPGKPFKILY